MPKYMRLVRRGLPRHSILTEEAERRDFFNRMPPISFGHAERYNCKRSGWRRTSTAVTRGVTPRSAEGSALHGLHGFRQESALREGNPGRKSRAAEIANYGEFLTAEGWPSGRWRWS